jgi:hypothetical protein
MGHFRKKSPAVVMRGELLLRFYLWRKRPSTARKANHESDEWTNSTNKRNIRLIRLFVPFVMVFSYASGKLRKIVGQFLKIAQQIRSFKWNIVD